MDKGGFNYLIQLIDPWTCSGGGFGAPPPPLMILGEKNIVSGVMMAKEKVEGCVVNWVTLYLRINIFEYLAKTIHKIFCWSILTSIDYDKQIFFW